MHPSLNQLKIKTWSAPSAFHREFLDLVSFVHLTKQLTLLHTASSDARERKRSFQGISHVINLAVEFLCAVGGSCAVCGGAALLKAGF